MNVWANITKNAFCVRTQRQNAQSVSPSLTGIYFYLQKQKYPTSYQ